MTINEYHTWCDLVSFTNFQTKKIKNKNIAQVLKQTNGLTNTEAVG